MMQLIPNPILNSSLSFVFLVKICSKNLEVEPTASCILRRNFSSKILCLNDEFKMGFGIILKKNAPRIVKNNLVNLNKIKNFKRAKMIATILILVACLSTIIWRSFVQDSTINLPIPESDNRSYTQPLPIAPSDIINQIEANAGKPILLYLYTTWCSVCKEQMPVINEIARKFQKTDLKVIAVAIDKNIDAKNLSNYLEYYKNIYFPPQYLIYNDGLGDLLKQKNIKYNKIIPLTVLVDRGGEVEFRFTGYKGENYIARKIMKTLK